MAALETLLHPSWPHYYCYPVCLFVCLSAVSLPVSLSVRLSVCLYVYPVYSILSHDGLDGCFADLVASLVAAFLARGAVSIATTVVGQQHTDPHLRGWRRAGTCMDHLGYSVLTDFSASLVTAFLACRALCVGEAVDVRVEETDPCHA